jgi:hypothetical protein
MAIGSGLLPKISKLDDADPVDESAMGAGWRSSCELLVFSPNDAIKGTSTLQSRELLITSNGNRVYFFEVVGTPTLGKSLIFSEVTVRSKLHELLK